ncbi:MAG TPA: arsenosugar biosynthesis radical SAM (seleno)protein ArsS [Candidatus Polarisedimenticolia bacterium]|nr:arsenosugar biosynthesis radical SAM (seleno)protein ArsS [Candidatus Polarisedimenticolia bacterium]
MAPAIAPDGAPGDLLTRATGDGWADFNATLRQHDLAPLRRGPVTTLQVNVGKRCNQACHHCHVEAGPKRTEMMDTRTARRVLELLDAAPGIELLDITGGAPELNENFRMLAAGARALGRRVIDRCNLTVLLEPGQEDTAEFLADQQCQIVASLPCYSKDNVEKQRGGGVFEKSLEALRRLNHLGYGMPGSPLRLDLVYNPVGASLPPSQETLESRYHAELESNFDIRFNHLITITNMPIRRFADMLVREDRLEAYMALLVNHFNPVTVGGLMCRTLLSVGYDGALYDCDFNQMLEIPVGGKLRSVFDLGHPGDLDGEGIATAWHCFGCTAGAGSGCGGALA